MSFSIPATLNVIERTGRNGVFMVAELITDIGTFDLKHRVLEQFQEGNYQGVFIITRIYTQSVTWKNGTWTKLCADLDWEALRIMVQSEEAIPSVALTMEGIVVEDLEKDQEKQNIANQYVEAKAKAYQKEIEILNKAKAMAIALSEGNEVGNNPLMSGLDKYGKASYILDAALNDANAQSNAIKRAAEDAVFANDLDITELDEQFRLSHTDLVSQYNKIYEKIDELIALAQDKRDLTTSAKVESPTLSLLQPDEPASKTSSSIDDEDLISDLESLKLKISSSQPVKLDATMEDRGLFRKLRDELKANGYRFNAVNQSWILAA